MTVPHSARPPSVLRSERREVEAVRCVREGDVGVRVRMSGRRCAVTISTRTCSRSGRWRSFPLRAQFKRSDEFGPTLEATGGGGRQVRTQGRRGCGCVYEQPRAPSSRCNHPHPHMLALRSLAVVSVDSSAQRSDEVVPRSKRQKEEATRCARKADAGARVRISGQVSVRGGKFLDYHVTRQ